MVFVIFLFCVKMKKSLVDDDAIVAVKPATIGKRCFPWKCRFRKVKITGGELRNNVYYDHLF
jgi:hypothetical protein